MSKGKLLFLWLKKVEQKGAGNNLPNVNEYGYNAFNDRLQEVTLNVNGVEYGKNTLTFDNNGRLKEVSPSKEYKYKITYDKFGNAQSFSLNGIAMLTKEYDRADNSITVNYHRTATQTDRIKTKYDDYGRLQTVFSDGSCKMYLSYQNVAESPMCANIKTMIDTFTGETQQPTEINLGGFWFAFGARA